MGAQAGALGRWLCWGGGWLTGCAGYLTGARGLEPQRALGLLWAGWSQRRLRIPRGEVARVRLILLSGQALSLLGKREGKAGRFILPMCRKGSEAVVQPAFYSMNQ